MPRRIDARRIAGFLREVEGEDAEETRYYANFLDEHADDHSFEDHFTDIGHIDKVVETVRERANQ